MICFAAEDVNTRNNNPLPSDRLGYSAGSRAVSLPERYMADNLAIFATVDYCALIIVATTRLRMRSAVPRTVHATRNHFVAYGGGGGGGGA